MSSGNGSSRILIIGAGLGGLTAGLALLKKGFDVQICEQATELKEVGAGLQLSANANRPLFNLGLESALRDVSCESVGKRIRLWNTAHTWKLFDLGAESTELYGYPYFTIHRADLQRILTEAVQKENADAIKLNAKCVDVTQDENQVKAKFSDGSTIEADALIGADGVHSVIRHSLFGGSDPVFSGCLAWRGVIDAEQLPPQLREPYAVNWIGPGGHVIHYPLRRGNLVNFVGILERDDWQVESWTQRGSIEECLNDFSGWHEDVRTLIRNLNTPFKWALMVREPMKQWTLGRITLLGDACHPTLPMLASGAAMAIEDAYILARALSENVSNINLALSKYEVARAERTARVVRGSAENTKRFHNPQLADHTGAKSYVEREWNEHRIRERYNWLFEYNVDTIPI